MEFQAYPFVVSWWVLALVVLVLAAYKGILYLRSTREGIPHLFNMQGSQVTRMGSVIHREEVIEKWGKILTVVAVAYGLTIAVLYVVSRIAASSTIIVG